MTDIDKQRIAALIECDVELNDWQTKFLETMEKCVENGYKLSMKQSDALERMYTELVLGEKSEKDRYAFGAVSVQKAEDGKLWQLWIIDQPYGEPNPRNDLLVVGRWLEQNLEHIAHDIDQDKDFIAKFSADVERLEEMKEEQEKKTEEPPAEETPATEDEEDEDCPF